MADVISLEVADRLAIRDIIDSYSNAVSRRDWDLLSDIFAENGIWRVRGVGEDREVESRAAVVEAVSSVVSSFEFLVQMPHAPNIVLSGDTATATTVMQEIVRVNADTGLALYGIYYDRLVRTESGWKFAERRFQAVHINPSPLGGVVVPDGLRAVAG